MFNEGLLKGLIKIGIEKGITLSILVAPTPLSISVLWSHSWGSLHTALWRGETQRWWGLWEVLQPAAHPLGLGQEAIPWLAEAAPLWPKPDRGVNLATCLKAGHTAGWKSALRGHKACLQSWWWSSVRRYPEVHLSPFPLQGRDIITFSLQ